MAKDKPGNQTAGTPDLSETELREMHIDELRERARAEGVSGSSSLRKEELVKAISELHREGGDGGSARGGGEGGEPTKRDLAEEEVGAPGDQGPDKGKMRTGSQSSKSLKYSQEITSLDDDPERAGRSLVTTSHEVIRNWAEERGGVPATVEGTEHGDRAGVLRFDFGERTDKLRHITWEEWFRTFDERRLNFLYQEERKDGRQSTFFRLENPEREDA
jgi:Rho termination factor, N-terminal domain